MASSSSAWPISRTTVSESIWEFQRSLLEALAVVLAVCLLSLGWRMGLVVAMSVPLVLGVVAIVMFAMGWNLERISLGSLIIALGLLVDDAIIALETMQVKLEAGWDQAKAAAFSYSSTAIPRLTGALITVAAFMPIGFEIVLRRVRRRRLLDRRHSGVFVGVGAFDAVSRRQDASERFRQASQGRRSLPDTVLQEAASPDRPCPRAPLVGDWRHRGGPGTCCRGHEVRAAAVLSKQLTARAPRRTPHERGRILRGDDEPVEKMEAVLSKDDGRPLFTVYTGAGAPPFYLSLNPELPNSGYAQFVVMTRDLEAREEVRARLMAIVDEQFPQAWVRLTRLELGPPVGYPVQFRVVGPDTQVVRSIAREVERVVAASPSVRDVQLDWNDPVRTLRVDVTRTRRARSVSRLRTWPWSPRA